MNPQDFAKLLAAAFEVAKRTDGAKFTRLRESSPAWMQDAVHAAHSDMMPDDLRYSMIEEVAGTMAEGHEWDEIDEQLDGLVDVYTSDLTQWLASHIERQRYVTEAVEELGWPGDVVNALQYGQLFEYREIFDQLRTFLEQYAESAMEDEPA